MATVARERSRRAAPSGRTEGTSIVTRTAPFAGRGSEAVERSPARAPSLGRTWRSTTHRRDARRVPTPCARRSGDRRCPGEGEPGSVHAHALRRASDPSTRRLPTGAQLVRRRRRASARAPRGSGRRRHRDPGRREPSREWRGATPPAPRGVVWMARRSHPRGWPRSVWRRLFTSTRAARGAAVRHRAVIAREDSESSGSDLIEHRAASSYPSPSDRRRATAKAPRIEVASRLSRGAA